MEGGQRDEVLGEIQLPLAIGGQKVVVGDGRLLLHLGIGAAETGDLGGGHILPTGVLREFLPDGLLKIGGLHVVDGEDGGEPQLADDLMGRGFFIMGPGMTGEQHETCSFTD